jgi:hypothetical protein
MYTLARYNNALFMENPSFLVNNVEFFAKKCFVTTQTKFSNV